MRPWAVAALAIGGTLAVGAVGGLVYLEWLIQAGYTGDPLLDAMRARVAWGLFTRGLATPGHMHALMAIGHNEHTSGNATALVRNVMEPGDLDAHVGPSIGPFQVSRGLAIHIGLWADKGPGQLDDETDRAAYLAFGTDIANLDVLTDWGCAAYAATLKGADGIWGAHGAVRLYNGPGEDALTYRDNAVNFAVLKWGSV